MVALSVVLAAFVSGCSGSDGLNEECAEAFERAALTVEQVLSAEYECGGSFGNPSQSGTVVLSVDTQEQATPVIEEIYKAFAAEEGLDSAWSPSTRFLDEGGTASFDDLDLDFNGTPAIRHLRDRYGIGPEGSD